MSNEQVNNEMPGARRTTGQPTITYLNVFPANGNKIDMPNLDADEIVGPAQTVNKDTLYTGKYLELKKYHFKDAVGNVKSVEGVHMVKNNVDNENLNGSKSPNRVLSNRQGNLTTIAVIKRQILADSLVLVKQYRAPLNAYTIEFPASVLHSEERPVELATKEIEDDTGYSSVTVKYISPLTSLEPDISDGKQQFVSLNIDGDDPLQHTRCKNNNQSTTENHGAHGDIVEVLKVPIHSLLTRLEQYDRQGCVVDSRVIAFAIGLQKGSNMLHAETVMETEAPH